MGPQRVRYRLDDGQIEVVDDAIAEALRRKSPGERLGMVIDFWGFARDWIRASIASQHPDWDGAAVDAEVSRRLLHESA